MLGGTSVNDQSGVPEYSKVISSLDKKDQEQIMHAEALRREAVEFGEWIDRNQWTTNQHGWYCTYSKGLLYYGTDTITIEKLYSQFKKEQDERKEKEDKKD